VRDHRCQDPVSLRQPPQPSLPAVAATKLDRVRLKREEFLNGLISEYKRAA
jgi:hypothetical protein